MCFHFYVKVQLDNSERYPNSAGILVQCWANIGVRCFRSPWANTGPTNVQSKCGKRAGVGHHRNAITGHQEFAFTGPRHF